MLLYSLFLCFYTASVQTHLLRQEVRGQRQPGDHQPAGLLPVWGVPPGDPGPSGILGEHLRAADGRPRQPLRFGCQPLPRLRPYGADPRRQLSAGQPQRQQLPVRVQSASNCGVFVPGPLNRHRYHSFFDIYRPNNCNTGRRKAH